MQATSVERLDWCIAQARRLYLHYNTSEKDCNSQVVARDFASLVELLEYTKTGLDVLTEKVDSV